MKFFLSILTTALVCVSAAAVQTADDCLDANRKNKENVCRKQCSEQEDSAAFSVSYDETNDSCRCYPKIEGIIYTASGDRESQWTCYSMAPGEETSVLDYGDCTIDSSRYGTKHTMQKCDNKEHQVECVDQERRDVYRVCHEECLKHDSAAFAVSDQTDDMICRCYPKIYDGREYTASGDMHAESRLTCFSMDGPNNIQVLDYGDCVPAAIYGSHATEHTMKRCRPQVENKLLRGSVSD